MTISSFWKVPASLCGVAAALVFLALGMKDAGAQTSPSPNPAPASPVTPEVPPAPGDQAGAAMATPTPSVAPTATPSPRPAGPPAPGTPAAEAVIRADYALQTGPLIKADLDAARAVAAPDFKTVTLSGRIMTRPQWLASTKSMEAVLGPKAEIHVLFHVFKWQGAQAVVEDEEDIKAPLHQGTQVHAFEDKGVSREVWGLVGTTWMIHSSTTLSESEFMDGHPVSQNR